MACAEALPITPLVWDSDVFTLYRNNDKYVTSMVAEYAVEHLEPPALTPIVVFEAHQGIEKVRFKNGSLNPTFEEKERQLKDFISELPHLQLDARVAALSAFLYPRLGGPNIGKLWKDMFIAATAHVHDYGVATRNAKDFRTIGAFIPDSLPPLRLAIWKS